MINHHRFFLLKDIKLLEERIPCNETINPPDATAIGAPKNKATEPDINPAIPLNPHPNV